MPEPREEIKNFSPYTAGMSIEEVKEKYNLKDVVKLASNENICGTSVKAVKSMKKEFDSIFMYPQSRNKRLISRIASKNSVEEEMVITGNGTDEIIELIAKTFLSPQDNIVVSENSFIRYKMAARLMGAGVKEIPQKDFTHSLSGLVAAIDNKTKIHFIDNPCNPTGNYLNRAEIEKIIKEAGKLATPPLIVLDEAYFEYVDAEDFLSGIKFLSGKKNLKEDAPVMVLRTFSKIAGLAGLRIGYGISSKGIIELIERIRPPFNTNRLAQAAALGAMDDDKFMRDTKNLILKEKDFLYRQLKKIGVTYEKSQTNFLLINPKGIDIKAFCEYSLKNGVILRPLNGYNLSGHLRVTVGRRKDNKKFISLLKEFLK